MRILLFGEYSGLHTNLKKGFESLGVDVSLFSTGDSYKGFVGDFDYGVHFSNKYLQYLFGILKLWLTLFKVRGYDVVQLISYEIIRMPYFMQKWYIKLLKRHNKQVIINRCGLDAYGITVLLGSFPYSSFQNELKEGVYNKTCYNLGYKNLKKAKQLVELFDGIIVNTYDYYFPYRSFHNYLGSAPLPITINTDNAKYKATSDSDNQVVKILYGITRKELKGHSYISEALDMISKKYADKVQITIVEKIPFSEYIDYLKDCDILIDQTSAHSYGMNALYAMTYGKVILSGNESEASEFLGVDCPVVNILPDSVQIYKVLESFIQNPKQLSVLGEETIDYTMRVHDSKKVAQAYLDLYSKNYNG